MKIECPTCDGRGEAVFSCCTGEVVKGDFAICPRCMEHLGENVCEDCGGTGMIEEGDPVTTSCDPQYQIEFLMEQIKEEYAIQPKASQGSEGN